MPLVYERGARPHTPFRIGQLGLGGISTTHRAGYRMVGLPVVAGYDPDDAARDQLTKECPDSTAHHSLDDFLADESVELVDLTVPHVFEVRAPILERLAGAGKPVLIQKPLSMTYDEARRMADIVKSARLPAMVNQSMCFAPSFLRLRSALIDQRIVGDPLFCHLVTQSKFDTDRHAWYGRDPRWWTVALTVHHLGMLHLLFGPPERVYALIGRDPNQPGVLGDGYGHLSLTYRTGMQAILVSTGAYYGTRCIPHGSESMWVQGSQGIVDWVLDGDMVVSARTAFLSRDIERVETTPPPDDGWFPAGFGLAMLHFQNALAAGAAPLCSVADNLYVMAVIEAAYLSAAEGRAVTVEEIMGDRWDPDYGPGWRHGHRP
ncbi:Gfo/Idh/MocA family oxidoreductase [Nonomuraea sp. MG754425]|uniref:Gfo/Idh/MocA family protein n=1 Tax=Nonomuraea sp. MG754425 TaxID=2570319 RepID=UPI0023511D20|nr:Gfo/Idh/MocA family oxidoreductase [Nonomuraea sp. MG754425]MCF6473404.1 Gfo/Idh/MocA family oxidoreductase [Nonomuraea sp. MG754425]